MLFVDATDLYYSAMAAILAGFVNLFIDCRSYNWMNWRKEKKFATFLGVFNILLGLMAILGQLDLSAVQLVKSYYDAYCNPWDGIILSLINR